MSAIPRSRGTHIQHPARFSGRSPAAHARTSMGKHRRHTAATAVAAGPLTDATAATDHHIALPVTRQRELWQNESFSTTSGNLRGVANLNILQRESTAPIQRRHIAPHDPERERADLLVRHEHYAQVRRRVLGEDAAPLTAVETPKRETSRVYGKRAPCNPHPAALEPPSVHLATMVVSDEPHEHPKQRAGLLPDKAPSPAASKLWEPVGSKKNKPCDCGSGKKWKKCCGATNALSATAPRFSDEVARVSKLWVPALNQPAKAVRKADARQRDKRDPEFSRAAVAPASHTDFEPETRISARIFMQETDMPGLADEQLHTTASQEQRSIQHGIQPPPPPRSPPSLANNNAWPLLS